MNECRLGDVAAVFNGKTPSKSEQTETGHPVLKIRDMDSYGHFRGFGSFVSEQTAERHKAKWAVVGDSLVLNAAHNASHVASKSAYVREDVAGSLLTGEWLVVRPRENADPRYVHHWLTSPAARRLMKNAVKGIHLYPKDVAALPIPLPPLDEQRRTAAILDHAEVLRAKRRQALAHLEVLTRSIFLDMFGDPVRNDRGWPRKAFGEVCETRLGKMLDAKQQTGEHLQPYLRNANVQWFRFELDDVLEMDFDEKSRALLRLKPGDLLICEGGQPGRAAIWRGEIEECYYQKALHRARSDLDLALPEFLVHLLWFVVHRGGLKDHVTSATIAHLTGAKLKAMPIVLPDIELQAEFVRRIEQAELSRRAMDTHGDALDALSASLHDQSFSGRL